MHRHALTEDQWRQLQAVLPKQKAGPPATLGDRLFIEAVLFRAKTGTAPLEAAHRRARSHSTALVQQNGSHTSRYYRAPSIERRLASVRPETGLVVPKWWGEHRIGVRRMGVE